MLSSLTSGTSSMRRNEITSIRRERNGIMNGRMNERMDVIMKREMRGLRRMENKRDENVYDPNVRSVYGTVKARAERDIQIPSTGR